MNKGERLVSLVLFCNWNQTANDFDLKLVNTCQNCIQLRPFVAGRDPGLKYAG